MAVRKQPPPDADIELPSTPRLHRRKALLKAGALQDAIFNSANFSCIATDENGVIQIFNVGAESMLGYLAAEVVNRITPADISDPVELVVRARALSGELGTLIAPGFDALVFKASRGIEDIYEHIYIRKDGGRLPALVSVTALRDAKSCIIGYLLIGTDNTARKHVEAEQKKLDQRLRDHQFYTRSLIESNVDALIITDPAGIITDLNKQMEVLTGCTRDELIGAPFRNCFTDEDRAEAAVKQVLREKKVSDFELTALSRDTTETAVSCNATTLYDRERKLVGVIFAARDISAKCLLDCELRETNQALENSTLAAEQANLAKSDFLSSMSHELRSPLNAILGFGQLIEAATPAPAPELKESVGQILQAGWYLLDLINEILDLSLIESGKLSLSVESISLSEVMLDCKAMIEPQAQKSNIHIHFNLPAGNDNVRGDRTRVKQVFINLLSNAIKYNRPGGTVEVSVASIGDFHSRVSFRDTGQGLSEQQQTQLFQPFNRLGQEAGVKEGTGIGLVVSKRLVELMGGKIGVNSVVGVGSEFWIELDSEPAIPGHIDDDQLIVFPARPGTEEVIERTVLYVEDNPANLLLVRKIMARRTDIKLLFATNGIEGVEMAKSMQPDVILMDINLPGLSGIAALRLLLSDPATSGVRVIALSANAMPRDIEKGLAAGFFRYLTKPIRVDELMSTLSLALEPPPAATYLNGEKALS